MSDSDRIEFLLKFRMCPYAVVLPQFSRCLRCLRRWLGGCHVYGHVVNTMLEGCPHTSPLPTATLRPRLPAPFPF